MRHRLANKSLSRPTAHRLMMLRNMVSSLLQHQQITTTFVKAKEAQKQVERVIGWGKEGGKQNWDRANAYLLNPTVTLRPLFTTYSKRYATRDGGYTRVHKSGNRQGDNADIAVLELVDSPHDLKYESTAAAVGREFALLAKSGGGMQAWWTFRKRVEGGTHAEIVDKMIKSNELKEMTKQNIGKSLTYRVSSLDEMRELGEVVEEGAKVEESFESISSLPAPDADSVDHILSPTTHFLNRAHEHYLRNLATFESLSTTVIPDPDRLIKQLTARLRPSDRRGPPLPVTTVPRVGRVPRAGEQTEGWQVVEGEEGRFISAGGPIGRAKGSKGREGRRREALLNATT